MKKVNICITNDIIYDRRIIRIANSLFPHYKVNVYSRRILNIDTPEYKFNCKRIKCIFNKGFLFYAEYNLRLFCILLFDTSAINVAVDYDTLIPVYLKSLISKSFIGFDAHEYYEESVEIVNRKRIQRFWKKIGSMCIKKSNLAYSVNDSISNIYKKMHGVEFHTIFNVPKFLNIGIGFQASPIKVILYQGVLNQGRELEMLIESAKYLDSNFEIWIIGEGDLSKELRERSKEENNPCKVIFHSWVNPEQLRMFTQQAFLGYNLLDESSGSYYYSLANKFFDYMHMGIPSLNNPYPEYQKINKLFDCCYLKNFKGGQDLASFFIQTVKEEETYKIKQNNAFEAAKSYNWQIEEKKLLKIYSDLLK